MNNPKRLGFICGFLFFFMVATVYGQTAFPPNSMVKETCTACHKPLQSGKLEVIEETRKSPEEWKNVIIRMMRLNHAPVDDARFYPIVKELSRYLCLTPEEMSQVSYYNSDENSQYREIPKDDLELRIYTACVRCHTYGKIASHRMTPAQWNENRNMHLGYYPTSVPQMREMDWYKESEALIEPLSKKFSFEDEKWREWMKSRQDQDLKGEWVVAGYQPGMGYYCGTYKFESNSQKGDDEYIVVKKIRYQNGVTLELSGEAVLYSGYHLRYALAPSPLTGRIEGVFDLDAGEMSFTGKWWTVVQDTNAFGNETFSKNEGPPRIIATFPHALKADPGQEQSLSIIGVGLPRTIMNSDISFSNPGIKVNSTNRPDGFQLVCQLEVGGEPGPVEVKVKDAVYKDKIILYKQIDGIKILPAIGRARVSCGAAYPPQGVQFVARAVNFGPDGKADTEDDMLLEPLNAKWWLEEEKTREGDDDMKYLAAPILNGLYTPVTTYGPIQARKQHREGVGLIAVGASVNVGGQELKDRALIAVTVPDFIPHIK